MRLPFRHLDIFGVQRGNPTHPQGCNGSSSFDFIRYSPRCCDTLVAHRNVIRPRFELGAFSDSLSRTPLKEVGSADCPQQNYIQWDV